jgi:hypothetical protein
LSAMWLATVILTRRLWRRGRLAAGLEIMPARRSFKHPPTQGRAAKFQILQLQAIRNNAMFV